MHFSQLWNALIKVAARFFELRSLPGVLQTAINRNFTLWRLVFYIDMLVFQSAFFIRCHLVKNHNEYFSFYIVVFRASLNGELPRFTSHSVCTTNGTQYFVTSSRVQRTSKVQQTLQTRYYLVVDFADVWSITSSAYVTQSISWWALLYEWECDYALC